MDEGIGGSLGSGSGPRANPSRSHLKQPRAGVMKSRRCMFDPRLRRRYRNGSNKRLIAGSLPSCIAGFHQSCRFSQSSGPRRSCVGIGPVLAGRPNGRPMTGSGGRSSIPEISVIESRSRGVLDTAHVRGMTACVGAPSIIASQRLAQAKQSYCFIVWSIQPSDLASFSINHSTSREIKSISLRSSVGRVMIVPEIKLAGM